MVAMAAAGHKQTTLYRIRHNHGHTRTMVHTIHTQTLPPTRAVIVDPIVPTFPSGVFYDNMDYTAQSGLSSNGWTWTGT